MHRFAFVLLFLSYFSGCTIVQLIEESQRTAPPPKPVPAPVVPPAPAKPKTFGKAIEVKTLGQFNREYGDGKNVVVYIGAEWCGPCRRIKPIVKQVATEIRDIKFLIIDEAKIPAIKRKFSVTEFPTMKMNNRKMQMSYKKADFLRFVRESKR